MAKRLAKTVLIAGLPFGVVMSLFFMLSSYSPASNIATGVVSGALFGVGMAAFAEYQGRRFSGHDPCAPGEELLKQGGANHRRKAEGVGGYLYLTSERLLFCSHKFNLQNHELSIPLEDISSVRPRLTAGFIPNGLEVVWGGEKKERFVVAGRREWARELREHLNHQNTSGYRC